MSVQVSLAAPYMAQPSLKQRLIILQTAPVIQRDLLKSSGSFLPRCPMLYLPRMHQSLPLIHNTEAKRCCSCGRAPRPSDTGLKWLRKMSQPLTDEVLPEFSCQTPSPHTHFRLFFRACMTPTVYAGNVNTQRRKTTGELESKIFYNGQSDI